MPETKTCPWCGRLALWCSTGVAIQSVQAGGGGAVLGYAGKMMCRNKAGHPTVLDKNGKPTGQVWSEPAAMTASADHRARSTNIEQQQRVAAVVAQAKAALSPTEWTTLKTVGTTTQTSLLNGGSWPLAKMLTLNSLSGNVRLWAGNILAACDSGGQNYTPEALACAIRLLV